MWDAFISQGSEYKSRELHSGLIIDPVLNWPLFFYARMIKHAPLNIERFPVVLCILIYHNIDFSNICDPN